MDAAVLEAPERTLTPAWPAALTLGFGGAVSMWALGYLARFPGVEAPAWLLGVAFLVCFVLTGFLVGRRLASVSVGAAAGGIAGAIDVLIFLSITSERREMAALAVPGSIGAGALLAALGAAAGRASRAKAARLDLASPLEWTGRFAWVAVSVTLLLLAVGGLVTSHDAGLAVPDWPRTFGSNMFLFPLERMTGGVYYEHTHRLIGALVGLTTLTFTALALALEPRRWVKGLTVLAALLVVVQGYMGGKRVEDTSIALAIAHGITAQVFFALLVLLAAVTSTSWREAPPPVARESGEVHLQLASALVAAVLVQLLLGALVRHLHIDPTWHICLAVVVITLGGFAGVRAWGFHADLRPLSPIGLGLAHALGLQLLLGIGALVVTLLDRPAGQRVAFEVPIATAHQTTGAVILGLSVLLRAWLGRRVAPLPQV